MGVHLGTIVPKGAFDLSWSIRFLTSWPAGGRPSTGPALRFAFTSEHDWQPVGVSVTQDGDVVRVESTGQDVTDQVARILSLDVDATPVAELARRDPVVADLVREVPGLRPVCFWTPWEAACWAVLSQRTSMRTAAGIKQRIGQEYGTRITIGGEAATAFPSPRAVLDAPGLPGVNPVKLQRIRGLALAALDGTLTAGALRAVPAGEALAMLRELPGVGPFSAALTLIRGAGAPDVFTMAEPRVLSAVRAAYGLPDSATEEQYRAITEAWRPLRSWVSFWLRATR